MQSAKAARYLALASLAFLMALAMTALPVRGEEDLRNLYLDAKPVLDVRYRFEFVDQDGRSSNAKANTLRTRAGLETGRFYGLGVGFDVEWIEAIGSEKFNNTINGKTQYPVVADPDDEQINQLYIVSENTLPDSLFKLGRQKIIWDNARFIGNVGFRQNEQTFDAFRGIVTALPDTALEYVYLEEVRRIFGTDSPVGEFGLNSHGIRAQYSGFEPVTITPFALLLDYDPSSQAGLDSQSYGVLLGGSRSLGDHWSILYEGSLAYQEDYADNPADFDLWYYRIEPGIAYDGIKLKAGYEVLEGDGTNAFQTPLATLHKFNGFTDQFLTTPPDGLEDLYLSLAAPLPGEGWLADLTFKAGYHQYWAEKGGSHYGWEWDAGVFKKIAVGFGTFNLGVQYASYDADNFSSDTDKLWLTLQFQISPKPLRDYLNGGGDGPS
jgi:hypothetical protein